jgi:AhpD family alkylhydroperoxidase
MSLFKDGIRLAIEDDKLFSSITKETNMETRLNYYQIKPKFAQKLMELSQTFEDHTLPANLMDICRTRASQLNGCTFCVDMHSKEAKIHGERELRLYHVAV